MELHNYPDLEKRGIMQVMEHPNGRSDADLAGGGSTADGADQSRRQAWASTTPSAEAPGSASRR